MLACRSRTGRDMAAAHAHDILSSLGVVIDGNVVHSGGVRSRAMIEGWLS